MYLFIVIIYFINLLIHLSNLNNYLIVIICLSIYSIQQYIIVVLILYYIFDHIALNCSFDIISLFNKCFISISFCTALLPFYCNCARYKLNISITILQNCNKTCYKLIFNVHRIVD